MKVSIKHEIDFTKVISEQMLRHKGKTTDWLETLQLNFHSAREMKNFEAAKDMIHKHMFKNSDQKKSKIKVYVDSDTDGFTSASIIYLWAVENFPDLDIEVIVPEGKVHGIIKSLIPEDTDFLIIPDASSSESELHKELVAQGIDILILDHHEVEGDLDSPAVILNPHQPGCTYKNKDLSGAGVVFKFIQAIDEEEFSTSYVKYADLAAVSLIADMMEMSSLENKAIANLGLSNLENPFLVELFKAHPRLQDLDMLTAFSISFYIAPVINAVIRVGSGEEKMMMMRAMIGLELPQTVIANLLKLKGSQDRKKEPLITRIVFDLNKQGRTNDSVILADSPISMPRSMTGLIAGQLADMYKRPVLIGRTDEHGNYVGSIRSIQGSSIEMFKDFCEASGMFNWVAGHQSACGFSMPAKKQEDFLAYCNSNLPAFEMIFNVDYKLNGNKSALIFAAAEFAPHYCRGFEEILFYDEILVTSSEFKVLGKNQDTFSITKDGIVYIAFRQKNMPDLSKPQIFKIVGKASLNEWMGNVTPQLIMESFETSSLADEL